MNPMQYAAQFPSEVRPLSSGHDSAGYETDFVAWLDAQSELLRQRRFALVDWTNVIEEMEELARVQRGELNSRLTTLAEHLYKLAASPAADPVRGWTLTVDRTRDQIEQGFEISPSLRVPGTLLTAVSRALPKARKYAKGGLQMHGELTPEAARVIDTLDLDAAKLLDEDWWPEGVTPPPA